MAYFAGLTNREIGDRLGLTVGGVERRLRQAVATVSDYVDSGRTAARRAVYGLIMVLWGARSITAPDARPGQSNS